MKENSFIEHLKRKFPFMPFAFYRLRNTHIVLLVVLTLIGNVAYASTSSRIDYQVAFLPREKSAEVRIEIDRADWLKQVRFNLKKHDLKDIKHSGKIEHNGGELVWRPQKKGKAFFSYKIPLNHQRSSGGYDAYITDDWTLLRGEHLVPPITASRIKKREREVYIQFSLPEKWTSVNAGWVPTENRQVFILNKPDRILPRPDGWVIAGQLGTRREQMNKTLLTVSAPRGHNFRQMELTTFLGLIWKQLDGLFANMPENLLIAGASDPMWRGGLSSPTSLYMHSDRPLVSENGTSTVLHELFHVISGIHGKNDHDWIAEGLAEYYSVELLFRAGGFSSERREKIFSGLAEWGKNVKTLRQDRSSGPVTARAAVFFNELDQEIQKKSSGSYHLDNLLPKLVETKYVELADLQKQYKALLGVDSPLLNGALVK